jgi:poly(A) polymerase Pap1
MKTFLFSKSNKRRAICKIQNMEGLRGAICWGILSSSVCSSMHLFHMPSQIVISRKAMSTCFTAWHWAQITRLRSRMVDRNVALHVSVPCCVMAATPWAYYRFIVLLLMSTCTGQF